MKNSRDPQGQTDARPGKTRLFGIDPLTREIVLGKFRLTMPQSRLARILIGVLLVIGGLLGFLPVLGFWMIPLGFLVLSHDLPPVRRWRRRFAVWWHRRRQPPPT